MNAARQPDERYHHWLDRIGRDYPDSLVQEYKRVMAIQTRTNSVVELEHAETALYLIKYTARKHNVTLQGAFEIGGAS